jgi:hypothetical protein
LCRNTRLFCTVYFASLYAPPRYLDEKFLRLMSAFTLLCTVRYEVSERTKLFLSLIESSVSNHFTEEERAVIDPMFPTAPRSKCPMTS